MRQRAQHIAMVLAVAPFLWMLETFLQALNGVPKRHDEDFPKFLWVMMWEELED